MRFLTRIISVIFLAFLPVSATTWNEPWQDEVVRLADLFVRVKITSASESKAVATVVKVLGGTETRKSIVIEGFSNLRIGSASSGHNHELDLPFKLGAEYYLLVRRDAGKYQLPTPTSGWAFIESDNVYATYRHSYHKALVPIAPYELTMTGIFHNSKGGKPEAGVSEFILEQLGSTPAELGQIGTPETKRFFLQHAALETIFHTGLLADLTRVEPFLNASEYQVQISAVRAAGRVRTPESQQRLMKFIEGKGVGFAKVMAVWALRDQEAKHLIGRLETYASKGPDEKTGFGGSIMDPRVGTYFPDSVIDAVRGLLSEWKRPRE